MRRIAWIATFVLVVMAAWWWSDRPTEPGPRGSDRRVIVIGFDGLDPNLLAEARAAGRLPNFSALATQGHLQSLATTDPPQSPVAWSSFATGTGPVEHGVFDFLHRDPERYAPEFSIATQLPPETLDLFGWQIPLRDGALVTRRRGEPFWLRAETDGLRTAVMRVPVTYPADPITHMLSGMGVPDLLGTQGTYTLIANHLVADAESGGRVLMVKTGEDGKVRTDFPGPASPTSDAPMTLPLVLSPSGDAVDIEFAEQALRLERELNFDPHNPRFYRLNDPSSLESVIEEMLDDEGAQDLMLSIGQKGYFEGEPLLIAKDDNGVFIVVEGNRRLAATKLLNRELEPPKRRAASIELIRQPSCGRTTDRASLHRIHTPQGDSSLPRISAHHRS